MAATSIKTTGQIPTDKEALPLSFRRFNSPFRHSSLTFRRFNPVVMLRNTIEMEIKASHNWLDGSCKCQCRVCLTNPTHFVIRAVKKSPKRLKYSTPRFSKALVYGGKGKRWREKAMTFIENKEDGGLLYVEVDPSGADSWKLEPIIEQLKEGAVGVIPTDTVYAIVCDMNSHSALERLRRIKNIESTKPLSILCRSFHDIDVYTMGFPRGDSLGHPNIFRAVKQCLPGPYTFILTASKNLPKHCTNYGPGNAKYTPKKSIGVRMPDDPITKAIVDKLDSPLISTSVKRQTQDEWILDPIMIADVYGKEGLDFIVDAGLRVAEPSTVVDMVGSLPKIIRLGKGPAQPWMVSEDDEDKEF